jgi:hypothetical protein
MVTTTCKFCGKIDLKIVNNVAKCDICKRLNKDPIPDDFKNQSNLNKFIKTKKRKRFENEMKLKRVKMKQLKLKSANKCEGLS